MGFSISSLSSAISSIPSVKSINSNLNTEVRTVTRTINSITSVLGALSSGSASNTSADKNAARVAAIGSLNTATRNAAYNSNNVSATNAYATMGTYGTADAASKVQQKSVGSDRGAFKWVQQIVTPDMFATPDSCLLGFGTPIRGANDAGSDFQLIGFCENININVGLSVITFKELRNERNIIIPTKSTPGSITITRMLGNMPNFPATVCSGSGWKMDTQSLDMKKLFGLAIIFMSPSRKDTISTLYAERCAIQSMSVGVQAGQFQMYETIQIMFDKLRDDTMAVTSAATTATTSTTGIIPVSTGTTSVTKNPDTGVPINAIDKTDKI